MRTIDLAGWGGFLAGVAALCTALRSCQTTDAVSRGSEAISNSAAEDHTKLEALTQSVHDLANNVNGAFEKDNEAIRDNGRAVEELSLELVRIARTATPSAPAPVLTNKPASAAPLAPRISVPVAAASITPFPHCNAAQQSI